MNTQQKGLSNVIVLLIVLVIVAAGAVGYFVIMKKSITPEDVRTQTQIISWTEYKWGILKFRYPTDWKIEARSASVILTPPTKTAFFVIPQVQAAGEDSITIGGQKSCSALGQEYHCETAYSLPIFTASNNSKMITVLQEISKSATLVMSSRDAETGIAVETTYAVNGKIYTEKELNVYLKKAPAGRYDIVAQSRNYKEMPSYLVLPVTQDSGMRFMMSPLANPSELNNSYLRQFVKPNTGLIVGFVVDEDGQSLSGVAVNSPNYSATTNSRGFYALNAIITESASCAGVDIIFSKSGYKAEKYIHAMSGSVMPQKTGEGSVSSLADGRINVTLQKGSGQNVTDQKHKLCP